jgi:hypothetical protein
VRRKKKGTVYCQVPELCVWWMPDPNRRAPCHPFAVKKKDKKIERKGKLLLID